MNDGKDGMEKLGHLMADLPVEMKNRIAGDLADKLLETMAGFPADIVLATVVNMLANGIAAAVKSEDRIDALIDRIAEELRPQVRNLYPHYDRIRSQLDGSKDT